MSVRTLELPGDVTTIRRGDEDGEDGEAIRVPPPRERPSFSKSGAKELRVCLSRFQLSTPLSVQS